MHFWGVDTPPVLTSVSAAPRGVHPIPLRNRGEVSIGAPDQMPETSSVVVVESPAKAKTINKYLGQNYRVLASYGHIRDLPAKDGSVDPNADFKMV